MTKRTINKDACFFSHDANAKDDPKCVLLIDQLGLEGYGIFWVLIETLRNQPDYKYPLNLLPALARRYNTTAEKVNTVVMSYELFVVENEKIFFSDSLRKRMIPLNEIRKKRKRAIQTRWDNAKREAIKAVELQSCNDGENMDTNVIHVNNTSNTDESHVNNTSNTDVIQRKEKKRKEYKEESIKKKGDKPLRFTPPSIDEVKAYCRERENNVDPDRFINFYQAKGWVIGKNKMKDWQAAVRTWEKGDNKNDNGKEESKYNVFRADPAE